MKKKYIQISALCIFLLPLATMMTLGAQNGTGSDFIEDLMSKMTLEEKIGQMTQYNGFWDATGPVPEQGDAAAKYDDLRSGKVGSMLNIEGVADVRAIQQIVVEESRLGIPLIFGFDIIHGYKTLAPIPLAEAASWDMEVIEKSANMAAHEAAAAGINWTFAPMMDISWDARWGRVMEGGGEDPFLASKIAAARVRGFQGDDLSSPNTIAACAKHYAGYGFAIAGRDYNTVDMSTNVLHNVVLPPFKAAVDAGVATVMNAFNELNGIPATAHTYLMQEVLRHQWGFDGFVVSDWASIAELVSHGYAIDLSEAAMQAANAGCDMDMEAHAYASHLKALVEEWKVSQTVVDAAVERILKVKQALGLFEDPYRYCDETREKEAIFNDRTRESVREVAVRSMVLLKNQDQLLPLSKSGQTIAVIGPLADEDNSPLGSWRLASDDHTAVSVMSGLAKYPGNEYIFHKGVDLITKPATFRHELAINQDDGSGIVEAQRIARAADVVIMVLGEHGFQSGEGRSRVNLDLPGLQQELLEQIYSVNQNIVLVLMNGRPLALTWATEKIPSILETWHLGTESGNAIAEVLMGDYNPSGKLPVTFPRSVGQVPIFYNHKNTGRPNATRGSEDMVFWSHYNDESNDPLYPFGFGLSYTTFAYSNLAVRTTGEAVHVQIQVTNTGQRDGEEVVQLYIRDRVASITRPVKELKGFQKISLRKGESKVLDFILTEAELGFYDNKGRFQMEKGEFDIMVGGNSRDLISATVEVK